MWGGKTKYQLVCISLLIKNTCVRCLLVSFLDSGILDVVFICSSLQVAGEISCVFNHIAIFFFFKYNRKMSLACFCSQLDFACGCPYADEL